eukprot:8302156-Alexandrium_andersonii.AAC.1
MPAVSVMSSMPVMLAHLPAIARGTNRFAKVLADSAECNSIQAWYTFRPKSRQRIVNLAWVP